MTTPTAPPPIPIEPKKERSARKALFRKVQRRRRMIKPKQTIVISLKKRDPPAHRAAARYHREASSGLQKALAHCQQLKAQQRARACKMEDRMDISNDDDAAAARDGSGWSNGIYGSGKEGGTMRRSVETLRYEYNADPRPFLEATHDEALWDNQIRGIEHVMRREKTPYHGSIGSMICFAPGRGKTRLISEVVRLDAIERVCNGGSRFGHPTLVVAPLTLVLQWQDQLKKFNKPEMLSFDVIYGKGQLMSTAAALNVNVARICQCLDLVITSYDTLRCGAAKGEKRGLFAVPWHRIVVDEGGEITNKSTDKFQAVQMIDTPRRIYVSGIHLPNTRIRELNAILTFLRCERLVPEIESTHTQSDATTTTTAAPFDEMMAVEDPMLIDDAVDMDLSTFAPPPIPRLPFEFGEDTIRLVKEITSELMIDDNQDTPLTRDEWLMKQTQIVWIPFREDEQKVYNEKMQTYLEGAEKETNRLAMYTELRKACLSNELFLTAYERANLPQDRIPHSKMQAVLDYERDRMLPEEKALVFGEWVEPLEILASHLKVNGISCEIMQSKMTPEERFALVGRVKDHTSPHPRMTLFPLKIGAAGLDGLQGTKLGGGANHVLLLQGHWTDTSEEQAKGRAARPGQMRRVFATKFVMKDSIEEHVLNINTAKQTGAALLFGNTK